MLDSNKQIKIGGIISYITIGFVIISGMLYTPWMISIIGQADYGLFMLATSLVTMVTIDLGLSQSVTRFVSKYRAEKDKQSIRQFLSITYKLFILLALVFLFVLFIVYLNVDSIYTKLSVEELEKVKILLTIAGLYSVVSFPFQPLDGLIESGEWFIFHKTVGLVDRVLNVLFMVVALLLGYGLYSLVAVRAISGLIVIVLKLYFLHKKDPQSIDWKYFDKAFMKEIFSFSMWVMIISIAQRLILSITPTILGMTSGSREIAIFSIASSIEGYIWTFSTVFGSMFLPKVSKLIYGENRNPRAIQELMIKVGRIQFIILGAIVSIFIMVGKDFYLNWVGEDFIKSYIITVLLVLTGLITVPQSIGSTALIASNQVKFNAMSKIIVAVLSLPLSYILSLKFGATGSGVAIFIGNLIGGALVMNIIYKRVLKIDIWEFFKKCHISMSLPFILVLVLGVGLNYLLDDISWINTFIKIVSLLLLYFLSAYYMAMNKYEKGLILDMMRKLSIKRK